MTIDEAIKVLQKLHRELDIPERVKEKEATNLGIEALKRVQHLRGLWGKDLNLKLPRETKD